MNFKKVIITLIAGITMLNISACGPDPSPPPLTSEQISSNSVAEANEKTRISNLKKYTVYCEYSQYINYDLYNTVIAYFNTMGVTKNKLLKEEISLTFTAFDNKKLDTIFASEPMEEIDQLVKDTSAQITPISNTLTEITKYYTDKTYLTDDYTKGKELHNNLIDQTKNYDTILKKFRDGFIPFKAQVEHDQLKYYQDNDLPLSYNCMQLLILTEEFDNAIVSSGHNSTSLHTTDVTLVQPIYDKIIATNEEIKLNIDNYANEGFNNQFKSDAIVCTDKIAQSTTEIMTRITTKQPLAADVTISVTAPGTLEKLREDKKTFSILFNDQNSAQS